MSFSDWIFDTNLPNDMFAALDIDAIVGNTSLKLFTDVAGSNRSITGKLVSSPFLNGIDHGIIYTLMRVKNNANLTYFGGIFCMADDTDPYNTGVLYVLQVQKGTANNVQIRKSGSSGIIGSSTGTQIGVSGSVDFDTIGDTVCIALEWDSTSSLGTELTGYVGTQTDFSDLAQFTDAVDNSSPLTTTVTEGIFLHQDSVSGGVTEILFDSTRIINL
jgi:hypothetical protein